MSTARRSAVRGSRPSVRRAPCALPPRPCSTSRSCVSLRGRLNAEVDLQIHHLRSSRSNDLPSSDRRAPCHDKCTEEDNPDRNLNTAAIATAVGGESERGPAIVAIIRGTRPPIDELGAKDQEENREEEEVRRLGQEVETQTGGEYPRSNNQRQRAASLWDLLRAVRHLVQHCTHGSVFAGSSTSGTDPGCCSSGDLTNSGVGGRKSESPTEPASNNAMTPKEIAIGTL